MYGFALNDQIRSLLSFLGLGFALGVVYDLLRIIRLSITQSKKALYVFDVLFALLCALLTFLAALSIYYGELHVYMLLAQITGFAVYYFTLDAFVQKTTDSIAKWLKGVYRLLFRVLSMPIRVFVRFGEKILKIFGFSRQKIEKNAKFLLQKMKALRYNRNSYSRLKTKDRRRKRATSDEET